MNCLVNLGRWIVCHLPVIFHSKSSATSDPALFRLRFLLECTITQRMQKKVTKKHENTYIRPLKTHGNQFQAISVCEFMQATIIACMLYQFLLAFVVSPRPRPLRNLSLSNSNLSQTRTKQIEKTTSESSKVCRLVKCFVWIGWSIWAIPVLHYWALHIRVVTSREISCSNSLGSNEWHLLR